MSRRCYDTTAADDIHKYFFIVFFFFLKKIRLDVSSESSARQSIHMKNQASSEDKRKKIKMSSAAIFIWCFKGSCGICWFRTFLPLIFDALNTT